MRDCPNKGMTDRCMVGFAAARTSKMAIRRADELRKREVDVEDTSSRTRYHSTRPLPPSLPPTGLLMKPLTAMCTTKNTRHRAKHTIDESQGSTHSSSSLVKTLENGGSLSLGSVCHLCSVN